MQFAEEFSRAWQDLKQDEDKFYIKYILEPFAKEWQTMGDLEKEKMVDDIVAAGKTLYDYEFPPDQIKSTFAYFVEEKTEQPLYKVDRPSVMAFAGNERSRSRRRRSRSRERPTNVITRYTTDKQLVDWIYETNQLIIRENKKGGKRDQDSIDKWNRDIKAYTERRRQLAREAGGWLSKKLFGNYRSGRVFNRKDSRFSYVKAICHVLVFLGFFWFLYAGGKNYQEFGGVVPREEYNLTRGEVFRTLDESGLTQEQMDDLREYVDPEKYYTGLKKVKVKKPTPVYISEDREDLIDARNVPTRYVVWVPSTDETGGLAPAEINEIKRRVGKTNVDGNTDVYKANALFPMEFGLKEKRLYNLTVEEDVTTIETKFGENVFKVRVPLTMKISYQAPNNEVGRLDLYNTTDTYEYTIYAAEEPEREVLEPEVLYERAVESFPKLENDLMKNKALVKQERFWQVLFFGAFVLFLAGALKDILHFLSFRKAARYVEIGYDTVENVGMALRPVTFDWQVFAMFLLFLAYAAYSLGYFEKFELSERQKGKMEGVASVAEGAILSDFMRKPLDYIGPIFKFMGEILKYASLGGLGYKFVEKKAGAKLVSNNDIASALRATEGDIKAAAKMLSGFSF